jgi:tetratricopeptide (TPR) repeat protein
VELDQRALKINEATFGPEHPVIATSLNNLAAASFQLHDYAGAEMLFQQALSNWKVSSSPNQVLMGDTLRNLGMVYLAEGRNSDALEYYKRAIDTHEAALGPNCPPLIADLEAYAAVLRRVDDYAGAEKASVRALGIQVRNSLHP